MRVYLILPFAGILLFESCYAGYPFYFGAPDPLLTLDSFSYGSFYPDSGLNKFSLIAKGLPLKGLSGDLVTFLPTDGVKDDGSIAKFIKNYDTSKELSFNGKGFKIIPKVNRGMPIIPLKGPEVEDILKGIEVAKGLRLDGPLIKEFQAEKASAELGALLGHQKLPLKVPIVKGIDVGILKPVSNIPRGFPIKEAIGYGASILSFPGHIEGPVTHAIPVHKQVISLPQKHIGLNSEIPDLKGPTIIRNAGLVEIPAPQLHLSEHKFAPLVKKPGLFHGKHVLQQAVKVIEPAPLLLQKEIMPVRQPAILPVHLEHHAYHEPKPLPQFHRVPLHVVPLHHQHDQTVHHEPVHEVPLQQAHPVHAAVHSIPAHRQEHRLHPENGLPQEHELLQKQTLHHAPLLTHPRHQHGSVHQTPIQPAPLHAVPIHAVPEHREPIQAVPVHTAPVHHELAHALPVAHERAHAVSAHHEPGQPVPAHHELAHATPVRHEPAHAVPVHHEPAHVIPAHHEAAHADAVNHEPPHTVPAHHEPAHAVPMHQDPAHVVPIQHELAHVVPVQHEPEPAVPAQHHHHRQQHHRHVQTHPVGAAPVHPHGATHAQAVSTHGVRPAAVQQIQHVQHRIVHAEPVHAAPVVSVHQEAVAHAGPVHGAVPISHEVVHGHSGHAPIGHAHGGIVHQQYFTIHHTQSEKKLVHAPVVTAVPGTKHDAAVDTHPVVPVRGGHGEPAVHAGPVVPVVSHVPPHPAPLDEKETPAASESVEPITPNYGRKKRRFHLKKKSSKAASSAASASASELKPTVMDAVEEKENEQKED